MQKTILSQLGLVLIGLSMSVSAFANDPGKIVSPVPTSLKDNAPIPSTKSPVESPSGDAVFGNIRTILQSEITRLCQQPGGCRFLLPTQEDVSLVHDQQKCPSCGYVVEILEYAVKYGYLPKEAQVLAAIDPNNPVLAEALKTIPNSVSPDFAARWNTLVDPKQNVPTGLNPGTLSLGPTVSVVVGADGKPKIQGATASRGAPISETLRANFVLGLSSSNPAGETNEVDLTHLPRLRNPSVFTDEGEPTREVEAPEEVNRNQGEGREGVTAVARETVGNLFSAIKDALIAIGEKFSGPREEPVVVRTQSTEDPNAAPIIPTSEASKLGLTPPTNVQQAFQLLHPGLTGDGGGQTASSNSIKSSTGTTESPDQNHKLIVDTSNLNVPTDLNSAATLRLGNVGAGSNGNNPTGDPLGANTSAVVTQTCGRPGSPACN